MTSFLFANNAQTQLSAPISSSATTLTVTSGTGALFPSPSGGEVFALTLNDQLTGNLYEIVYVTARTVDSMTVMRGQEGTTARSWVLGDYAVCMVTAGELAGINNGLAQNLTHGIVTPGTGNWPVPTGVSTIQIICVGGGGGGSDSAGTTPGANYSSGAGGGAGGTAIGIYSVTSGQLIPISIGAAGGPQINGGTTTVTGFCSATGGSGANFATVNSSPGGVGGTASGGQLNLPGATGSDGQNGAFTGFGNGGASFLNGGGRAGFTGGQTPSGYGAGGGGSYGGTATGGSGGAGIVIVIY